MNRAYIVSNDGRIFYAEPDSNSFNLLEYNTTNINNVKIKRVSSSSWCIWSISSNLNLYLFVYLLDTPYEHQEITYENQRRYNFLNKNSFSNKLLPTDRPHFSSREGDLNLPKESFQLPSSNWTWKTDWNYELNASDGWEYAVDFPSNYHTEISVTSFVRRRKWMRNRVFTTYHQFIKIDNPSNKEYILDVSIGGWLIPFKEKGYLSVWIVSSAGRLYFRKNVSHSNPEGDEWIIIPVQEKIEVLGCSCSARGDLWIITSQGEALMRTGISRDQPYGTGWSTIQSPTSIAGIKEISLGTNSIWCLDNQGQVFYRAGITNKNPQGNKWVYIPSFMSDISCSISDQLWTFNLMENSLFFRYGIDDENLSGIGWKTINLKYNLNSRVKFQEDSPEEIKERSFTFDSSSTFSENESESKIQEKKTEEKKVENNFIDIEYSIYDEDYQSSSAKDTSPTLDSNNNQENSSTTINEPINLEKFQKIKRIESLGKYVQQTNIELDNYINNLIQKDEYINENLEISETKNNNSKNSEISQVINLSETGSVLSETSEKSSDSKINDLLEMDIKSICINSFRINQIPAKWYDTQGNLKPSDSFSNIEFKRKINSQWRNLILSDLIKRNIREFVTIDKISVPYENDSTWSRKETFQILYRNKLISCILEIVHSSESIKKNVIFIKFLNKSDDKLEQKINFEDILVIKPYVLESRKSLPCFAIYLNNSPNNLPLIFCASSKSQMNEWINQISIYCTKVNFLNSLNSTFSLVTNDGYSYFLFVENYSPIYLSQLDGHFKQIEKHTNGFTYGCGENGKFWFLKAPNNNVLESYKGPYDQSDELEIYTYENQRWNVVASISGLLNSKAGFTKLGLPTDRYPWSDETGKIRRRKEECQLPSSMFEWVSNWQIDFSLEPAVDKSGWQYAVDFPFTYYGVCNPLKHYVRRRRWVRKCRIVSKGLWLELNQSHKLTCISLDQERKSKKNFLEKNEILIWATDSYGCVLSTLLNDSNPTNIKWKYVTSENQTFNYVCIGPDLKIWSIDSNGNVYYRASVSRANDFCGTAWIKISSNENIDEKFVQLSVGKYCVWAISKKKELYFRENISKAFSEGTNWIRVDYDFKYVTVNSLNQVYAITSETASEPNVVLYREGVSINNPKGTFWKKVIPVECKMISNKGYSN